MRKLTKESKIPCDGCTVCCQGDLVFLHPEMGDDPSLYETIRVGKRLALAHKDNGDCYALHPGLGCGIHAIRPAICRELDCRIMLGVHAIANDPSYARMIEAARAMVAKIGPYRRKGSDNG